MILPQYYQSAASPVFSFELFPPKTPAGMNQLNRILPELIAANPSYMTVTYGALGTTRQRTLEIAQNITRQFSVDVACHLTCVGSSRSDLSRILQEIYDSGIRNIVALRGDPPAGETAFVSPADGFSHANQLVEHIRSFESGRDKLGIAVAGYPEKHIEAPSMQLDLENLKRKVDAGADIVITQLFYDNQDYFQFVEAARSAGITQPIIPGLLPVQSTKQILRITSLCGSKVPEQLKQKLASAADDDEAALQIGIDHCVDQASELIDNGAPGIHFYVLNKSKHIVRIMESIAGQRQT